MPEAPPHEPKRHGSCLEHGEAHAQDHWSRRDFLARMGLATAGVAFSLGGVPLSAYGRAPMLHQLGQLETDRVLVLLQLRGGNDGLNTIIPVNNSIYYQSRPTLAIRKQDALLLDSDTGLHPAMQSLEPLWNTGQMAVIHNVGYDQSTRSHFEGTVNWVTAREQGAAVSTGWTGRYLADEFLIGPGGPLEYPLAVRVGSTPATLFHSDYGNLGVTFADSQQFERFLSQGGFYDPDDVATTVYGEALSFVRQVTNASFRFVESVQNAAEGAANLAAYPGSSLAENLAVVARLIRGRLGARVFAVSEGGFDTHSNQGSTTGSHANRLRNVAEASAAFLADLAADGLDRQVVVMTFSEFGRTLRENGSNGTDHGAGAPLLLFGPGLRGGLYGAPSSLQSGALYGGDPRFTTDYRDVYSTVLRDWFGLPTERVEGILGGSFGALNFVDDKITVGREATPAPHTIRLDQNYPNPFNASTRITYSLSQGGPIRLHVFDIRGRLVRVLADHAHVPGIYTLDFDGHGLPSGAYLYRLETPAGSQTRRMVLVR